MNKSLIAGLLVVFALAGCTTNKKYTLRNPSNNDVVTCGGSVTNVLDKAVQDSFAYDTIDDVSARQCVMMYTGQGYKLVKTDN